MLVKDIMNPEPITAMQTDTASRAARLLSRHNIGFVPVLGVNGNLRGIVTDRDLTLRCIAAENDPETTKLNEVMSRCIITCKADDDIASAVKKMENAQIRRLPVTENGKLIGILSLCDIARSSACREQAAEALSEISANIRKLT